ncbi:carbohydrate ABC transporter permease, partial [bacterium]|nr:carbohydrate ABC transporter permease [bacterium]
MSVSRIIKYLFITIFIISAILPFWWLVSVSLREGNMFSQGWSILFPEKITLDYYKKLLFAQNNLPLVKFFCNTLIYCLLGVTLEVVLASLAAYPLARLDFKGKNFVIFMLAALLALPSQANTIINFITIRNLGLYDTVLGVVLPTCVNV